MSDDWIGYSEYKTHIGKAQERIAALEAELSQSEMKAAESAALLAGARKDCLTFAARESAFIEENERVEAEVAQLEAELQQARDQNRQNLQKELLDLITLMPDSQTQEIVDYIATLRSIRALRDAPGEGQ